MSTLPLQFLILTVAGWVNRNQQDVIDYLRKEKRILREHVADRRIRFSDSQRLRLALKAKKLSRKTLTGMDPIVTRSPRKLRLTVLSCGQALRGAALAFVLGMADSPPGRISSMARDPWIGESEAV